MLGTAQKAYRRGFNVVGMNMRNCGGTEHLAATLYHSGMTEDIRRVILEELAGREGLTEIFLAGFSMSGNMVLRLAGDYGAEAPPALKGVAAVSPSIDLDSCAAALERRGNALYRWNFVKHLRERVRRKGRLQPGAYDTRRLRRVRTIREFDEHITAPHGGYRDAADYYARTSSRAVIGDIESRLSSSTRPTTRSSPRSPSSTAAIADNPDVLLVLTRRGGHVGFLSDRADAKTATGPRTASSSSSTTFAREDRALDAAEWRVERGLVMSPLPTVAFLLSPSSCACLLPFVFTKLGACFSNR